MTATALPFPVEVRKSIPGNAFIGLEQSLLPTPESKGRAEHAIGTALDQDSPIRQVGQPRTTPSPNLAFVAARSSVWDVAVKGIA